VLHNEIARPDRKPCQASAQGVRQMKMSKYKIVLICAFALLNACIPVKFTETPRIYGRVIDSESKNPISGANIYFKKHPEKKMLSDLQGKFVFEPIMEWIWIPLGPFDLKPPRGDLLIEMTGYEKLEKMLYGPPDVVGDFELTKKMMSNMPLESIR
jgi:hypothetical protein